MATSIALEAMRGANFARVVRLSVASGDAVAAGQTVFEVENHKVVQEIESPASGTLVHALQEGALVRLAAPIAFVAEPGEDIAALRIEAADALAPADSEWEALVCPVPAERGEGAQPVSIAKATEIAVLGGGAARALQATLGARIGPVTRDAQTAGFFADKIADLVVYEAARLLASKKYKALNARFAEGAIVPHERVVAGVSFDEGKRLTIYAIPGADTLALGEVQDAMVDGLMRYVGRRLTLADVGSATFTVSDVTATDLNLSVPLLPRDQAIIIVVIRDGAAGFSLAITYDHRITEGLTVANFATELVKRVRAHAAQASPGEIPVGDETAPLAPACSYCERSVTEEVEQFRRRGLVRIIDHTGHDALVCSSCWEGW
jgi:pyruvate/2-oxoglutarate dehydrogenase complex dihydrolipoamide acyltransferase (E2) component